MVALASSLSGPIDEYLIREDLTPSGTVWSVTAKASYQDRFRQRALELKQVREKLRLLQNRQDNQDLCIITVEIYSRLSSSTISHSLLCILLHDLTSPFFAVLHALWFTALPEDVRSLLKDGPANRTFMFFLSSAVVYEDPSHIVPRILAVWMTLQDHISPVEHHLPLFLDDYRPLISDDPELKAHLIDADQQETPFGVGARLAWGFIDPIDRNLMLFSWAVRQDSPL
jgi:hypothetical protein